MTFVITLKEPVETDTPTASPRVPWQWPPQGRQIIGATAAPRQPGPPARGPYLHLGLKSSLVWGFFSFKTIISWSSRRKVSKLLWFRKVLSSLAFSGLSSTLYLASISPKGSCSVGGSSEGGPRECAAGPVGGSGWRDSLFSAAAAAQTCAQRGAATGR